MKTNEQITDEVSTMRKVIEVLVIEDDDDDFHLVENMLKKSNQKEYVLTHCGNLTEGIDCLRTHQPQIILLDLGLAETTGLETLDAVIKFDRSIPIIVLTGINDEELGEQSISKGAEDYLPKDLANKDLLTRMITYSIERHRLIGEIDRKAAEDSLTGLLCRSAFLERLDVLINNCSRNRMNLAVAIVDLDDFKIINDTYGHSAGDQVLSEIGGRLKINLRKSDLVARYGGDEFILALTNYKSSNDLYSVIRNKHAKLIEPISIFNKTVEIDYSIGVSVGVSEYEEGMTVKELIDLADVAMYKGKNDGKNSIILTNN